MTIVQIQVLLAQFDAEMEVHWESDDMDKRDATRIAYADDLAEAVRELLKERDT